MSPKTDAEVLIVGGGPCGSMAATVLAMHGRDVLIVEKEKFPRYHIGESLLPYCYFPLERAGVLEKMSRFQPKFSVQFVSMDGRASQPFYFQDQFDHPASSTWQVLRSEFDQLLLDNARDKGARVLEETRVQQFLEEDGNVTGVRAVSKENEPLELRARVTIDATGRSSLALGRLHWRRPDPRLKKIAIWTYYRGAKREQGRDEGATTVGFLPEGGWFWYIPLAGDLVSVGAVAERDYLFRDTRDLAEIFDREAKNNRWIEEHLEGAKRVGAPCAEDGPLYVTSEWSYGSERVSRDGLVLAGDAFGFLDPIFSSGVLLALRGGERAGDVVHEALGARDVSAARFEEFGESMRRDTEAMRRLVYAFYDESFSMRKFLDVYPHLKGDVTECLIGNLSRDFGELFAAIDRFLKSPPGASGNGNPVERRRQRA